MLFVVGGIGGISVAHEIMQVRPCCLAWEFSEPQIYETMKQGARMPHRPQDHAGTRCAPPWPVLSVAWLTVRAWKHFLFSHLTGRARVVGQRAALSASVPACGVGRTPCACEQLLDSISSAWGWWERQACCVQCSPGAATARLAADQCYHHLSTQSARRACPLSPPPPLVCRRSASAATC